MSQYYAWLGSNGFQYLFGTTISWSLNVEPELRVLSSLGILDFTLSHISSHFVNKALLYIFSENNFHFLISQD